LINKQLEIWIMKRLISISVSTIFLLVSLSDASGQSAALSSGGDASGSGGTVAYSVGQAAYTHFSGESGNINLGVQQPYQVIMVGTSEPEVNITARIFPNPVQAAVHLELEFINPLAKHDLLSYGLYDATGKLLISHPVTAELTLIPMDQLTDQYYFLRVMQSTNTITTFKIFKTN
jgi:hypothetical protein